MGNAVEMTSCNMIYVQSFMKICAGTQAILRFCLRNLRGCDVGITDGKDFWIVLLRWGEDQFHKVWLRHSKVNTGIDTHTHTHTHFDLINIFLFFNIRKMGWKGTEQSLETYNLHTNTPCTCYTVLVILDWWIYFAKRMRHFITCQL
jgi:hypothetical protein